MSTPGKVVTAVPAGQGQWYEMESSLTWQGPKVTMIVFGMVL